LQRRRDAEIKALRLGIELGLTLIEGEVTTSVAVNVARAGPDRVIPDAECARAPTRRLRSRLRPCVLELGALGQDQGCPGGSIGDAKSPINILEVILYGPFRDSDPTREILGGKSSIQFLSTSEGEARFSSAGAGLLT
jgi:hypothetical protein